MRGAWGQKLIIPKCVQTCSNSRRFSFYKEECSGCWWEIVSPYMGKYKGLDPYKYNK